MQVIKYLKPRLLLLSDIWGETNSEWTRYYMDILSPNFVIQFYDVCALAGIDRKKFTSDEVHHEFINGGIDRAVIRLLEKETEPVAVLGFSIGGLIAWQASLSGLKTAHLFAVSSTRLRYEIEKPNTEINLIYGSLDPFAPDNSWFEKLEIEFEVFENEEHEMYRKQKVAVDICTKMMLILK